MAACTNMAERGWEMWMWGVRRGRVAWGFQRGALIMINCKLMLRMPRRGQRSCPLHRCPAGFPRRRRLGGGWAGVWRGVVLRMRMLAQGGLRSALRKPRRAPRPLAEPFPVRHKKDMSPDHNHATGSRQMQFSQSDLQATATQRLQNLSFPSISAKSGQSGVLALSCSARAMSSPMRVRPLAAGGAIGAMLLVTVLVMLVSNDTTDGPATTTASVGGGSGRTGSRLEQLVQMEQRSKIARAEFRVETSAAGSANVDTGSDKNTDPAGAQRRALDHSMSWRSVHGPATVPADSVFHRDSTTPPHRRMRCRTTQGTFDIILRADWWANPQRRLHLPPDHPAHVNVCAHITKPPTQVAKRGQADGAAGGDGVL